jgi:DNA repair exonuclease SbcCD ATPase subunit
MKIDKLYLKDFGSHKDTTVDFEKLTVVRGINAVGKSTIEQAIELMLAGRSGATDDRGAGAKELIRKGADKALVGAQITIDGSVRKLRMSLTEKSGRTLTAKNGDDNSPELVDYFRTNRDTLSCLCNGRFFIDMDEAEQKDFLAGIVLPRIVTWDESVQKDSVGVGMKVDWSAPPFEVIDAAYGYVYESRRVVNVALKAWQKPAAVPEATIDAEEIRRRLAERQSQRTSLAVARSSKLDAYERTEMLVALNDKKRAKLTEKIRQMESELGQIKSLGEAALKGFKKVAAQEDKAKQLDQQLSDIAAALKATEIAITKFEALADTPKCPTCEQAITAEVVEKIGAPLVEDRARLIRDQRKAFDERKQLGDYEGAKKAIAGHEQALRDHDVIAKHLEEAQKELEAMESTVLPIAPNTSEIDQQISDLDARIEKGNRALYEAGQAVEKKKAFDAAWAQKRELDKKLELLEKLVEYFGANGIKAKVLQEHVGGFNARMNKVLARWGYYCELNFEPYGFTVQFSEQDKAVAFSLRTLSASQRYRFATAFQLALAQLTFKFCVIDGADILDDAGRQELYRALRESELDQVIVMQADARTAVPKADGTVFYMVSMQLEEGVPTSKVVKL